MSEQHATSSSDTPPPAPRRRDSQRLSSMQIVFAAILSIGLLLVINFSGRIARSQQMENEHSKLESTLAVLQEQQTELLQKRDYAASDTYIEDWAHTEGKQVREGEILVIPIPDASVDVPTPEPPSPALINATRAEDETSRWKLWWNLFFDGNPPF